MSREFRLGLFIAATLIILAVGVFLIGSNQTLFQSTYPLQADFRNASGLSLGADVRVGGIQKGNVRRIDLPKHPDGNVVVVMDLRKETRDVLKEDSVASIKSEGLVGDKYVEISFGSPGAPKLKDWDRLKSEPPIDISDLFTKADQILDTAHAAILSVAETAGNMTSITSKIKNGQGTVGALINDRSVYNQAQATMNEAHASVAALHEDFEALKHNFLLRGFFKKRGYEDADEITKHQIASLPQGEPEKTFSYDGKQLFSKPDAAKLKDANALSDAGNFLQQQKTGLVVVAAAMGMKGDSQKEKVLTEARASVVRDYLVSHFRFDDTRLKTIGLGKTDNAGDDGKVEIIVYPEKNGGAVAQDRAPGNR